jgi:YidC/Oxa1 family membrane protein insertase
VPNATTVWTADKQVLTPALPVTLSWDNGQGLTFKRIIDVDDNAMFTIRDEVEQGRQRRHLFPSARSCARASRTRSATTCCTKASIGYLGEQGLQEWTYDKLDKEPRWRRHRRQGLEGRRRRLGRHHRQVLGRRGHPGPAAQVRGRFSSVRPARAPTRPTSRRGGVAPGAHGDPDRLFAGAKEVAAINAYETAAHPQFDLLIDWGWFYFITKPMFFVIDWIYKHVGNFGVAILIVTVLLKGLFFPLANKSYASMAKMKAVQPEDAIRERYADDKMKQQQAMMELYKTEKINPLAGCWPVLVQIPVFFALYKVLFVTIEMRHAPFFGWIHDLAAPDPTNLFNLFGLLPFTRRPCCISAWPIIMGITMFIQMKMNPTPPDPTQKMIFTWMPVIFTFMLGSFPAGLVIYWSWNNLLSVPSRATS